MQERCLIYSKRGGASLQCSSALYTWEPPATRPDRCKKQDLDLDIYWVLDQSLQVFRSEYLLDNHLVNILINYLSLYVQHPWLVSPASRFLRVIVWQITHMQLVQRSKWLFALLSGLWVEVQCVKPCN